MAPLGFTCLRGTQSGLNPGLPPSRLTGAKTRQRGRSATRAQARPPESTAVGAREPTGHAAAGVSPTRATRRWRGGSVAAGQGRDAPWGEERRLLGRRRGRRVGAWRPLGRGARRGEARRVLGKGRDRRVGARRVLGRGHARWARARRPPGERARPLGRCTPADLEDAAAMGGARSLP
jgi:hypothetical protein